MARILTLTGDSLPKTHESNYGDSTHQLTIDKALGPAVDLVLVDHETTVVTHRLVDVRRHPTATLRARVGLVLFDILVEPTLVRTVCPSAPRRRLFTALFDRILMCCYVRIVHWISVILKAPPTASETAMSYHRGFFLDTRPVTSRRRSRLRERPWARATARQPRRTASRPRRPGEGGDRRAPPRAGARALAVRRAPDHEGRRERPAE